MADPRKALAAKDSQFCHIEALMAGKIEAAEAITAACPASKEANAKRDEESRMLTTSSRLFWMQS